MLPPERSQKIGHPYTEHRKVINSMVSHLCYRKASTPVCREENAYWPLTEHIAAHREFCLQGNRSASAQKMSDGYLPQVW